MHPIWLLFPGVYDQQGVDGLQALKELLTKVEGLHVLEVEVGQALQHTLHSKTFAHLLLSSSRQPSVSGYMAEAEIRKQSLCKTGELV